MSINAKQAAELNEQRNIVLTNLAKKRVEKNMSQRNLAVICGISSRTIQLLEQRTKNIEEMPLSDLIDICLALDCSIIDILESADSIQKLQKIYGGNLNCTSEILLSENNDTEASCCTCQEQFTAFLKEHYLKDISNKKSEKLDQIIGRFSSQWICILKQKYVDNLSVNEISLEIGLEYDTIETILCNATRILKSYFKSESIGDNLPDYEEDKKKAEKPIIPVYERSVKELKLKIRTHDLLRKACIITIGDAIMSKEQLMDKCKMTEYMAQEVIDKTNEYVNNADKTTSIQKTTE